MTDEKFWSLVEVERETQCWIWRGETNSEGRASFRTRGSTKRIRVIAARHAWTLLRGRIPKDICIGSTCWNYRCVNPDHHAMQTHGECIRRAVQAGRMASGELNPMYKHGRYVGIRSSRETGRRNLRLKNALCKAKRPSLADENFWHLCKRLVNHEGPHRVAYAEAFVEWERNSLIEKQRRR